MDPPFSLSWILVSHWNFFSLQTQLKSSVIGCRLLLILVPLLHLVQEVAVSQYRPVLQKNMSSAASIGTYGRFHWYGWPPLLVRMAASNGRDGRLYWYGWPPPLVLITASIGTYRRLYWYVWPPPLVLITASIGTDNRLYWYGGVLVQLPSKVVRLLVYGQVLKPKRFAFYTVD